MTDINNKKVNLSEKRIGIVKMRGFGMKTVVDLEDPEFLNNIEKPTPEDIKHLDHVFDTFATPNDDFIIVVYMLQDQKE